MTSYSTTPYHPEHLHHPHDIDTAQAVIEPEPGPTATIQVGPDDHIYVPNKYLPYTDPVNIYQAITADTGHLTVETITDPHENVKTIVCATTNPHISPVWLGDIYSTLDAWLMAPETSIVAGELATYHVVLHLVVSGGFGLHVTPASNSQVYVAPCIQILPGQWQRPPGADSVKIPLTGLLDHYLQATATAKEQSVQAPPTPALTVRGLQPSLDSFLASAVIIASLYKDRGFDDYLDRCAAYALTWAGLAN